MFWIGPLGPINRLQWHWQVQPIPSTCAEPPTSFPDSTRLALHRPGRTKWDTDDARNNRMWGAHAPSALRENVVNYCSTNIGQPMISSLESEGQLRVVHA